jgi:hypothetical protein
MLAAARVVMPRFSPRPASRSPPLTRRPSWHGWPAHTADSRSRSGVWFSDDQRADRTERWTNALDTRKRVLAGVSSQRLVTGGADHFLPHLSEAFTWATQADLAVAFIKTTGPRPLLPALESMVEAGVPTRARVLTRDYLDITDPEALRLLYGLNPAYTSWMAAGRWPTTQNCSSEIARCRVRPSIGPVAPKSLAARRSARASRITSTRGDPSARGNSSSALLTSETRYQSDASTRVFLASLPSRSTTASQSPFGTARRPPAHARRYDRIHHGPVAAKSLGTTRRTSLMGSAALRRWPC